ncbi:protein lifeguard 4-like [Lethenteron reissneri]|uniref:protein lifeguard 4-like n=1 Tax=Lethenteron reissneri TaxID=7753 RepID=UPI002AB755F4|nr:protein lifeguard 4-like [Lethenteron reissneri]XP_061432868.1 protein lifeguard 4-like [Lethenteron reissneri]
MAAMEVAIEMMTSDMKNYFGYRTNVATAHVSIRMGFLRKVYAILSVQILLTVAVAVLIDRTDIVEDFIQKNSWVMLISCVLSMGLLLALFDKRRDHPTNLILLFAFTLVEAFTLGVVVTFYDQVVVFQACVLTAAAFVGLTVYTLQTKRDFSCMETGLFAGLWILIIAGYLGLFLRYLLVELALAGSGALLFCGFVVWDTQRLLHSLSPEDYVEGAVSLYLDLINLFLDILRLLEAIRRNSWVMLISCVLFMGSLLALLAKRRDDPSNLFLFFTFTLVQAFTLGVLVTFYDHAVVLPVCVLMDAAFVGLIIFTLKTKRNLSRMVTGFYAGLWILIIAGFLGLFLRYLLVALAVAGASALRYCGFMV